ncbi:MAG: hypothetical protein ABIF77_05025 [bacterium]
MASRLTLVSFIILALAALTAGGCSSDSSSTPTAIDTAPPEIPTGLEIEMTGTVVHLAWAPNTTDADFAGFVVDRTVNGTTVALVEMPQNVTEITDNEAPYGLNIYAVSAVDQNGNESAFATINVMVEPERSPGHLYKP